MLLLSSDKVPFELCCVEPERSSDAVKHEMAKAAKAARLLCHVKYVT